ncbi:MAG: hypothetical protein JSR33_12375 [Proteobacteria bacterium]|nr:hypothetical protein [Pseudomonadota bacterium]
MAEHIDDISIEYSEDGIVTTKQLDKTILTRGAWTTIIFRYQTWDKKSQKYGPEAYSIRRYQKKSGTYQQRSKFNISSAEQAKQIIEVLNRWISE